MLINQIINVDEEFESGEITEPVTLQQTKDYLRLGGFVSDESGEQEFDFDDALIEAMISEGRMWLEKYTGQYVVPRSLNVVLLNQAGGQKLPGPVSGDVIIYDYDDESGLDLQMVGTKFPKIITPYGCDYQSPNNQLRAVYEVGYNEYPAWVQNAILAYVAWSYENRGDEQAGSPERAAAIARAHRKGGQAWG